MGHIDIVYVGKDSPEAWQAVGGKDGIDTQYKPVIQYLCRECRYRDIVHTVPGGPEMAAKVQDMLNQAIAAETAMPFDMKPIVDVMAALRGDHGCPWDKAQTHRSLRRYLLEEVYETLDAIDADDTQGIREELGDVLYQVVIHARIAEEAGLFSAQDIVNDITKKMIHRHPHVFSEKSLENEGTSVLNWDRLKQDEQRQRHAHLLDGVITGLPSLLEAYKLQEKAGKVGFDWDDVQGVWDKAREEWQEFKEALTEADGRHAEEEAGDVLFVFANVCRHYHIEPESALHQANRKFRRRFAFVEDCVKARSGRWSDFSVAELDAFWQEAKRKERAEEGRKSR